MSGSNRGSLWRRWDLHLHAPGTKLNNAYGDVENDEVWNRYLDFLEESPVEVFGITDYFSADTFFELLKRHEERFPNSTKTFFLNLEFRLAESISKDGSHPDIHVIFDNDPVTCSEEKIGRFLTNLQTQSTDDAHAKKRCTDLYSKADFEAATVTLDHLLKALGETFGNETPYLLAFPSNNNGIKSTDSKSPRKRQIADRIDATCNFFFGNANNREYFLDEDRYKGAAPKPVVSGSDAHSFADLERLSGDESGYPGTWIKADTTFIGLRQICHEPESRLHIGEEPDVIVRQRQDGTKFLDLLEIDQADGYGAENGEWFKRVELPLNPELTAIIGNKGSGKSAVVDIIGLLGESRQEKFFSFLTDQSTSKKFRQRGYAENFEASVTWLAGKQDSKNLSENTDPDKPETVRYLPQNYFEQLTNDIEIEEFRREIEDVVFSHVDETDRLGKSTFAELEESKTLQSKHEISDLKQRLRETNVEIVRLEEKSSPHYRRQIVAEIDGKRHELEALEASKPKEVAQPGTDTPEQRELVKKVDALSSLHSRLKEQSQTVVLEISALKAKLQRAVSLRDSLLSLITTTRNELSELKTQFEELDLEVEDIVTFSTNLDPLQAKIAEIQTSIAALETNNNVQFGAETDFEKLRTLPDLRAACDYVDSQIDLLKEQLGTPQRRYQAYVERLNDWKEKHSAIKGSPSEPKPGTLSYLEDRLREVDESVAAKLEGQRQERRNVVGQILESKNKVLSFYEELKGSVEGRLEAVRTEGFEIEIDASFVVTHDFRREFLDHINQRRKGPFRNNLDAQKELDQLVQNTDWNSYEAIIGFCEAIIERMRKASDNEELSVADQAHDAKKFYDYLFSIDYLSSRYELRLGGKNLNELSPGEKGLLLLIFYLQLDRNNTPLVIDQPEDNLDNDSIFKVLAACIRDAKKHRQVILVTHNPNLAVGADAEEIVYVKLEKAKNYKFSYESGSIENPKLNQRIVDVLEGSQPAFVKRRLKYGIR